MKANRFPYLQENDIVSLLSGSLSLVWIAAAIAFTVIVYGQIAKRAGFSRWWSLLLLFPVIGNLVPILFAVVPWPVEKARQTSTRKRRRKSK